MSRASCWGACVVCVVALVGASEASATSINQSTSWTIKKSGASQTYRVVAYGDSIFAGFNGNIFSVGTRAAPLVAGEYAATAWNANIEVVRRAKSGAKADAIYEDKILDDRKYMQDAKTRVVMFEMCGNDYLIARDDFAGQDGVCNVGVVQSALDTCTYYMELAMQAITAYSPTATARMISNIYYPGYNADNALTECVDGGTGQPVNKQDMFMPFLARSNWRACNLAERYGFVCIDSFAEYMGADYDSNGDGVVDSEALRYRSGESEEAYVVRISQTLRGTIRDSNGHLADAFTSFDYMQSDDTHPTLYTGSTIGLNWFTGNGSGSGNATFQDGQIVGGKSPVWVVYGHERMGWAASTRNPASP